MKSQLHTLSLCLSSVSKDSSAFWIVCIALLYRARNCSVSTLSSIEESLEYRGVKRVLEWRADGAVIPGSEMIQNVGFRRLMYT